MNVTITPGLLSGAITPPPSTGGLRPTEGMFGGSAAGGSRTAISFWFLEGGGGWRA